MDSIVALKDHSCFKYVHSSRFAGQSKEKEFVFKMSVDLPESGVNLIKRTHVGGNMENLNVKRSKDWTTFVCHVYDSKFCKVLTITCCDMQFEDIVTQMFFWKKMISIISENELSKMNFKDFMTITAYANWNAVKKYISCR